MRLTLLLRSMKINALVVGICVGGLLIIIPKGQVDLRCPSHDLRFMDGEMLDVHQSVYLNKSANTVEQFRSNIGFE